MALKHSITKDGSVRVETEKGNLVASWTPQTERPKVMLWIAAVEAAGLESAADALWDHITKHGMVEDSKLRRERITLSNIVERIKNKAEKEIWGKILH